MSDAIKMPCDCLNTCGDDSWLKDGRAQPCKAYTQVTDQNRLDADRHLAEALGWTNLFNAGGALLGTPPTGGENSRGQAAVPRWTLDDASSFSLEVEYTLSIWQSDTVEIQDVDGIFVTKANYEDHPTRKDAVRYAIVIAVTALLTIEAAQAAAEFEQF